MFKASFTTAQLLLLLLAVALGGCKTAGEGQTQTKVAASAVRLSPPPLLSQKIKISGARLTKPYYMPAFVAPAGRGDGLPLGQQLIGIFNKDRLSLGDKVSWELNDQSVPIPLADIDVTSRDDALGLWAWDVPAELTQPEAAVVKLELNILGQHVASGDQLRVIGFDGDGQLVDVTRKVSLTFSAITKEPTLLLDAGARVQTAEGLVFDAAGVLTAVTVAGSAALGDTTLILTDGSFARFAQGMNLGLYGFTQPRFDNKWAPEPATDRADAPHGDGSKGQSSGEQTGHDDGPRR